MRMLTFPLRGGGNEKKLRREQALMRYNERWGKPGGEFHPKKNRCPEKDPGGRDALKKVQVKKKEPGRFFRKCHVRGSSLKLFR